MHPRLNSGSTLKVGSGLFAALLLTLPAPASTQLEAQDLSYTTVTTIEMGGAMGAMMQMVPDFETETRQTTYMKGMMVRTDDEDQSTIVDGSAHTITIIDHESRTFYTLSMEQMIAQGQAAQERAAEMMGQQGGMPGGMPGGQMMMGGQNFEPEVSFDRTGETGNVAGYSAERVLMVMEMAPAGPEAEEMAAMTGKQAMVSDSWYSSDLPGYEAFQELYKEMAEQYPGGGIEAFMGSGASEAMMANPMMKEMMESAQEEMQGLEGMPVKTVTSMVTVPVGAELDLDAVLEGADQPLEAGEGMSMQDAAMEAARGAMGRSLGGLMGRGRGREEPEAPAGPTAQSISMRTVTLIEDVQTAALSADLFQPPSGYTERAPEWMRGG